MRTENFLYHFKELENTINLIARLLKSYQWIRNGIHLNVISTNLVDIFFFAVNHFYELLNGPLSGLRQFLTTESPSIMLKNALYLMLKTLLILKIFIFLS